MCLLAILWESLCVFILFPEAAEIAVKEVGYSASNQITSFENFVRRLYAKNRDLFDNEVWAYWGEYRLRRVQNRQLREQVMNFRFTTASGTTIERSEE